MSPKSKSLQPILNSADTAVWLEPLPGEKIAIRVDGHETGQLFAVGEAIVASNAGPPLHIHHNMDEIIYVLEGTVDFVCDGKRLRTGPGGTVVIPRGVPHAFRNFADTPARLLGVFLPGGFEQLFVEMNGRPAVDILGLAAKHNMEIVGPPIDEPNSPKGANGHLHAGAVL